MTDITLVFEVHQPYRIKRSALRRIPPTEGLLDFYFDLDLDRRIFDKVCQKCYFPSNEILLGLIDEFKKGRKKVKIAFGISGVLLEQCDRFNKDLLESFRALAQTGCVEFLDQPYYHSLALMYPEKVEFIAQVRLHHEAVRDLLGYDPKVLENTELIYNNEIARIAADLGYKAVLAEGTERVLGWRSANYVYQAKDANIKLLLRNYRLSDDIGFRFSARWWNQWPLTADKYASWLTVSQGQCINIFLDYETFGEHHWPETGIHDFLMYLPREVLKWEHLNMSTPSEVAEKYGPVGEIDVPSDSTTSWSGLTRDLTSWLGNDMQRAYFRKLADLESLVKESRDEDFSRIWRCFGTSDHLHNMFSLGGPTGAVHDYFSPYESPLDAFINCQSALIDFEARVKSKVLAANEPFLFCLREGEFTGTMAWSLRGFSDAVKKVDLESLRFHLERRDFERWARLSLCREDLARGLSRIRLSGISDESLRGKIISLTETVLS